jgi:aspartate dehydrogenase
MKKKIGIVGCGFIGKSLAKAIREKFLDKAELYAVYDINLDAAKKLGKVLPVSEFIDEVDIIIEAASPSVVRELVPLAIAKNKKILVMSTGGLLGMSLKDGVYFPSGAIAGLDGLAAATQGEISKITLTTTKPQYSLNHHNLKEDTVVFSGKVEDAIAKFPKNINVCATLAIVSRKPEIISVNIIASPTVTRNIHKIDIEGDFGKMTCILENVPSPENPKTSYLTVLSAIDALKKILYG